VFKRGYLTIEFPSGFAAKHVVDLATQIAQAGPNEQVELERGGLPAAVVASLASALDLPRTRLLEMMDLPRASIEKKIAGHELLSGDANRRAFSLLRLLAQAREILRDSSAKESEGFDVAGWLGSWLETPQPALGGRMPAELLDTEAGARAVERTLGAMRSGAYL
jgi:putative toxin-antitoxin system antitoxin component (TIGR02293 family)